MRKMGLWKYSSDDKNARTTEEEKLPEDPASSSALIMNIQDPNATNETLESNFNKDVPQEDAESQSTFWSKVEKFFSGTNERQSGYDYYIYMVTFNIASLIIMSFFYQYFTGRVTMKDKHVTSLAESMDLNTASPLVVLVGILNFCLAILDRVIYKKKMVGLKILVQLFTLVVFLTWVIFASNS